MKRNSSPSSHSVTAGVILAIIVPALAAALTLLASPEVLVSPCEVGQAGGRLVLTLRTEPKSFNPIFAGDNASRTAINLMHADLVHINRVSHLTEPALASACAKRPSALDTIYSALPDYQAHKSNRSSPHQTSACNC